MTAVRKIVLLLVAAGSVLSAQAQPGQGDVDRRLRNREEAMERRLRMDREGGSSVPPAVIAAGAHGHRMHHGHHMHHHGRHMHHGHHMHHGRMHMRHHHPHRHPVR